jgi:hypothetical protein
MSTAGAPIAPARGRLWYGYCAVLVIGAVVPAIPVLAGYMPNGIVAGAGLLLIAAALLILTEAVHPVPSIALVAAASAALPGVLLLAISLLPTTVVVFVFPLTLVDVVWQGPLTGVGLISPHIEYPFHEVVVLQPAVALLLLGTASAVTAHALLRHPTAPLEGLALGGPGALLMALAATEAAWPIVPLTVLVTGLGLMVAAGLTTLGPWRRTVLTSQGGVYVISGLLGALPTRATTVVGLALVAAAAGTVGLRGRVESRVPGWVFAGLFTGITAGMGGLAVGLDAHLAAFAIVAATVGMLAVASALRGRRRREASALEATAHAVMLLALAFTAGWMLAAQLVCAVWALAAGLRAAWPGTSSSDRRFLLVYSGAWWLLASWLVLGRLGVPVVEAYTLPLAGLAALAGWASRRRWPRVRRRQAYAPAAVLALVPTLLVAVTDLTDVVRWLTLGLAGVAFVVTAARTRTS